MSFFKRSHKDSLGYLTESKHPTPLDEARQRYVQEVLNLPRERDGRTIWDAIRSYRAAVKVSILPSQIASHEDLTIEYVQGALDVEDQRRISSMLVIAEATGIERRSIEHVVRVGREAGRLALRSSEPTALNDAVEARLARVLYDEHRVINSAYQVAS